jgi:hypothetical protein
LDDASGNNLNCRLVPKLGEGVFQFNWQIHSGDELPKQMHRRCVRGGVPGLWPRALPEGDT